MLRYFLSCLFLISTSQIYAQIVDKIEPEYIRTIQFQGGTNQSQLPIINLGERLQLSFDDIKGDEADYFYTITHQIPIQERPRLSHVVTYGTHQEY